MEGGGHWRLSQPFLLQTVPPFTVLLILHQIEPVLMMSFRNHSRSCGALNRGRSVAKVHTNPHRRRPVFKEEEEEGSE